MKKSVSPANSTSPEQRVFDLRWLRSEADLMEPLRLVYGDRPDFGGFIDDLKALLRSRWNERPAECSSRSCARRHDNDRFTERCCDCDGGAAERSPVTGCSARPEHERHYFVGSRLVEQLLDDRPT